MALGVESENIEAPSPQHPLELGKTLNDLPGFNPSQAHVQLVDFVLKLVQGFFKGFCRHGSPRGRIGLGPFRRFGFSPG
jgi:hypothetical protein